MPLSMSFPNNLDFLKSFTLNSQDVNKNAILGFVCSWQTKNFSNYALERFFPDGFEEVMSTTGVDNIDIENTKAVVKTFMKDIIAVVSNKTTREVQIFDKWFGTLDLRFPHDDEPFA